MVVHVFFVAGAVICTAIVAKYVWKERESFWVVYNDIKKELKKIEHK